MPEASAPPYGLGREPNHMMVKDAVGVLVAIVVVAGIAVMVKNGTGTANVLVGAGNGFATAIRAATGG